MVDESNSVDAVGNDDDDGNVFDDLCGKHSHAALTLECRDDEMPR